MLSQIWSSVYTRVVYGRNGNTNRFYTRVLPTPSVLQQNTIIYCSPYKSSNESSKESMSGIFQYNPTNDSLGYIELWCNLGYYPLKNTVIYNPTHNTLISAGGHNGKDNDKYPFKYYSVMMVYNIDTAQSRIIDIGHTIGDWPRLVLTNNDNHLHIIGGCAHIENAKHILFDFATNKSTVIHSFHGVYSSIHSQGLLYRRSTNTIIMFGGVDMNRDDHKVYDDFWLCDVNHKHKWKHYVQCRMPSTLYGFGSVLYDDRIIIVFGGDLEFLSSNDIYYFDLDAFNGWKTSDMKMKMSGSCNAVLMNNDTIHILPDGSGLGSCDYYTFHVSEILPPSLLILRKNEKKEQKLYANDEVKEEKENTDDETGKLNMILKDLNKEMELFKRNYDEQQLQEMMRQAPIELIQPDSTTNTSIKMFEKNVENISLSVKLFAKYINDMKLCVNKLCVVDAHSYKTWNLDDILVWILTLDEGKYQKYEGKLRNGFIKSEITSGSILPHLKRSDLSNAPFNIDSFIDKKHLIEHFKRLEGGNASNNDEMEGTETQYI